VTVGAKAVSETRWSQDAPQRGDFFFPVDEAWNPSSVASKTVKAGKASAVDRRGFALCGRKEEQVMRALVIGQREPPAKTYWLYCCKTILFGGSYFRQARADIRHEKLHIHFIGFNEPEKWRIWLRATFCFRSGTTLKTAGSKAAQWEIDYAYQYLLPKSPEKTVVKAVMCWCRPHFLRPNRRSITQ
jgi:hypothetical protein